MPLYGPPGVRLGRSADDREQQERLRIRRITSILRHGSADQRRRALNMRMLPLPEDPEAVAVPATALLDLPGAVSGEHGEHNAMGIFDPLAQVAQRYGADGHGDEQEVEGTAAAAAVDYSVFLEVLCPNGTSLLESLPLTPRTSHRQQRDSRDCVPTSRPQRTFSPSSATGALRSASSADAPIDAPITFDRDAASTPTPPGADESVSASSCTAPPALSLDAAVAAPAEEEEVEEDGADAVSDVFASGGSASLFVPRRSRGRRSILSFHRSSSQSSRAVHAEPPRRTISSLCNPSTARSSGNSALGSPAEPASPITTTFDTLSSPPNASDAGELGGRILFTDRLVTAHSHTALPTMISAFQQYVKSTPCSLTRWSPGHGFAAEFYTQLDYDQIPDHHQLSYAYQRLAPRQRGIPLKSYNTSSELLRCVQEAERCERPTFRRVDPADLYGSSHYVSDAFVHKTDH
ncbi:hypothetical protein NESM_000783700 [Novymonas esmeraldas]|uniref:Uncharacterized protein n=1 Tax=Novymonas esmeraldas TaxID=1808958 RepID=A0AAW0EXR2_9TRYP